MKNQTKTTEFPVNQYGGTKGIMSFDLTIKELIASIPGLKWLETPWKFIKVKENDPGLPKPQYNQRLYYGLYAPKGAGKTTLVNKLNKELAKDGKAVALDGDLIRFYGCWIYYAVQSGLDIQYDKPIKDQIWYSKDWEKNNVWGKNKTKPTAHVYEDQLADNIECVKKHYPDWKLNEMFMYFFQHAQFFTWPGGLDVTPIQKWLVNVQIIPSYTAWQRDIKRRNALRAKWGKAPQEEVTFKMWRETCEWRVDAKDFNILLPYQHGGWESLDIAFADLMAYKAALET